MPCSVGLAAAAPDGLAHVAGAAVVGGDGQRPVAEDHIVVLEQTGGGPAGGQRVETLIHVGGHFQAVHLGRVVHELPHTLGPGARDGAGVEGRFDDSHGLEFLRQTVFVEDLLEQRHVVGREADDAGGGHRHPLGVADDGVLDSLVELHGDERVHLLEPVDVHLVGDVAGQRVELQRGHVEFVDVDLLLDVVEVQQRIDVVGVVLDQVLDVVVDQDVAVGVVGRGGEHLVLIVEGVVGVLEGVQPVRQLLDQEVLLLLLTQPLGVTGRGAG